MNKQSYYFVLSMLCIHLMNLTAELVREIDGEAYHGHKSTCDSSFQTPYHQTLAEAKHLTHDNQTCGYVKKYDPLGMRYDCVTVKCHGSDRAAFDTIIDVAWEWSNVHACQYTDVETQDRKTHCEIFFHYGYQFNFYRCPSHCA